MLRCRLIVVLIVVSLVASISPLPAATEGMSYQAFRRQAVMLEVEGGMAILSIAAINRASLLEDLLVDSGYTVPDASLAAWQFMANSFVVDARLNLRLLNRMRDWYRRMMAAWPCLQLRWQRTIAGKEYFRYEPEQMGHFIYWCGLNYPDLLLVNATAAHVRRWARDHGIVHDPSQHVIFP